MGELLRKMRILVVSPIYPPEPIVSSLTSAEIAEELRRRGNEVTVITAFPNRPAGRLYPGFSRRLYQRRQSTDGIEVIRCFATLSTASRVLSRSMENLSFGVTSGLAALFVRRPNVIYSNTWPIFATGLLWFVARMRNIPMVVSVQDVYPESLMVQGRIRADSRLARWLTRIDRHIVQRCRSVIVISESFASIYRDRRGVAPEKVHVVPNWIDERSVTVNDARAADLRAALGVPPDSILLAYGGNVGAAAAVETVVESFQYLQEQQNVYLLIAGEGAHLPECQRLAEAIGGHRIRFYNPWPKAETSLVLSAADILVLPTRGTQSLASVPSKLVTYMLAARPIIALAASQSDLATVITRAKCGWLVEPDRPESVGSNLEAGYCTWQKRFAEIWSVRTRLCLDPFLHDCLPAACHRYLERRCRMSRSTTGQQVQLPDIRIRPMQDRDLEQIVAVHNLSFRGFFLTFLGPRFLKLLYQNIGSDAEGVVLVASSEQVEGFVAGVMRQSGFYRRLVRHHKWAFARASLGAVLRKPSIAPRLLRALRRPTEAQASAAEACLMSIAVRPEVAGQGLGQQLIKDFCRELSGRGVPAVCLTTDRDDNERVNQFYQRLGFQLHQVFVTPKGRAMNEYVISLPLKG